MTTITIKNIPKDVYDGLKQYAHMHGRSLNKEIIHLIGQTVLNQDRRDVDTILKEAREIRKMTAGCKITPSQLQKAKIYGRP